MLRKFTCLTICFLLFLPFFSLGINADFEGDDKIVVVLDPGHGGKDSGALGTNYESYYNLKVAQYCADALNENGNFTVKMTRTTQSEELTLAERGVYADSVNADIIVSIHFNSSVSSSANGIEVYTSVLPQFDLSSLAKSTASKLGDATGLSVRGCYEKYDAGDGENLYYWSEKYQWDVPNDPSVGGLSDHYGIITWAAKFGFPGIIIEHAYLSNPHDMAITNSEETLKRMGEADAEALIEYYTKHEHSYSATYTQDYPVSCFSAGKKSIHCTICGHRKDVTAVAASSDPDAHLWIADSVVEPTCTSVGSADMICRYTHNLIDKGCEQFEEHTLHKVLPKLEHNYTVTFYQELTHTQDGITEYTCTSCKGSYRDIEYAEGHSYEFVFHTDPTCTTDGGDTYECVTCGDRYTDVEYAFGHTNAEIERTEPTCDTDGEIKYECSVCNAITSEILPQIGHTYVVEVLSELNCTTDEEIRYTCSTCGDEYTEKTAAGGHDYKEISSTDPSCEDNGITVLECTRCKDTIEESITALGHEWDSGTVVRDSSLFSAGEISYLCLRDDSHLRTEVVESKLSSFVSQYRLFVIIAATVVLLCICGVIVVILLRSRYNPGAHDYVNANSKIPQDGSDVDFLEETIVNEDPAETPVEDDEPEAEAEETDSETEEIALDVSAAESEIEE